MLFENTTKLVAKKIEGFYFKIFYNKIIIDGSELEIEMDLNVYIIEKAKIESNMNRK